jgi:hypothetical protein
MASRFYKLTYFKNKNFVHAVINLHTVAHMERFDNSIRIIFNNTLLNQPHGLYLTFDSEKECDEMYDGIEKAMNPINKLA